MRSPLSEGRKQRILLARALYRQPRSLFLDKGTLRVGTEREKDVNESLRSLDITSISIAHRPHISGRTDAIIQIGVHLEQYWAVP
jgi:ATP-binding cassette subfamily B protein RaxB